MPPGLEKNYATRQYHHAMRNKTMKAYGERCACCGEDDPRFLCVDHIHNDGKYHRAELMIDGQSIHEYLFDNGYPKNDFQLLCYNCNSAKQFNTVRKGVCPHELDRNRGIALT